MKKSIAIYLAGSIKKGHEKSDESYWTEEDMAFLKAKLSPLKVSFLNPAFRSDDLSDQLSVFGRDMMQVFCSDVVFVDARDRRGLGVGAEMMWAKWNRIPVVTLSPKDSHYHKSSANILGTPVENWVHPFVEGLSDCYVENLTEGAQWIQKFLQGAAEAKGREYIEKAMQHYKDSQLEKDAPMKEILSLNERLSQRSCNFKIRQP